MTDRYLKAMAVGAKLKSNEILYEMTNEWYGSEQCRVFTQILVNAIDYKNDECKIEDLMYAIIEGINNLELGDYDEYARGYITGERIGAPTEKNKEKASIIEEKWNKYQDKYGYYQEVVNEVMRNG